jgi:hypothetical protein
MGPEGRFLASFRAPLDSSEDVFSVRSAASNTRRFEDFVAPVTKETQAVLGTAFAALGGRPRGLARLRELAEKRIIRPSNLARFGPKNTALGGELR